MTLRTFSRLLALGVALGTLNASADPSPAREADLRTRAVERATSEIHRRLRDARATGDATKQTKLDDLLKQAGAALRRATVVRSEALGMIAEAADPRSRLTELAYLERRARGLVRVAESLDGGGRLAPDTTTVTVHVVPLPAEPQ